MSPEPKNKIKVTSSKLIKWHKSANIPQRSSTHEISGGPWDSSQLPPQANNLLLLTIKIKSDHVFKTGALEWDKLMSPDRKQPCAYSLSLTWLGVTAGGRRWCVISGHSNEKITSCEQTAPVLPVYIRQLPKWGLSQFGTKTNKLGWTVNHHNV